MKSQNSREMKVLSSLKISPIPFRERIRILNQLMRGWDHYFCERAAVGYSSSPFPTRLSSVFSYEYVRKLLIGLQMPLFRLYLPAGFSFFRHVASGYAPQKELRLTKKMTVFNIMNKIRTHS